MSRDFEAFGGSQPLLVSLRVHGLASGVWILPLSLCPSEADLGARQMTASTDPDCKNPPMMQQLSMIPGAPGLYLPTRGGSQEGRSEVHRGETAPERG